MALLSLEELVDLKRRGVGSVDAWVDAFATGQHREGEPYHSAADLDAIAANFDLNRPRLVPPVVLGHSDDQEWLKDTGLPAAGVVSGVRRRGDLLQVQFAELPRLVCDALRAGLYYTVSAEIYPEPPAGCGGAGPMLRRVALLGGDLPAVKRLRRLDPASVRYAESLRRLARPRRRLVPGRTVPTDRGTVLVYSEVTAMALDQSVKDTLVSVIKAAHPDLPDDFLASLDDDQLQQLATSASGGDGGADAGAAPDVAALHAELTAAGEAGLEGLTDCQLRDRHAAWKARQAAPPPPDAPDPAKFAERVWSHIDRRLNARVAGLERSLVERDRAEREKAVRAYCEKWARHGYVLPREVDAASKKPNLYHRLMAADAAKARKYGETVATEFDSLVAEVEERGPGFVGRFFAERLPAPLESDRHKDAVEAAKKFAAARNGHAKN